MIRMAKTATPRTASRWVMRLLKQGHSVRVLSPGVSLSRMGGERGSISVGCRSAERPRANHSTLVNSKNELQIDYLSALAVSPRAGGKRALELVSDTLALPAPFICRIVPYRSASCTDPSSTESCCSPCWAG